MVARPITSITSSMARSPLLQQLDSGNQQLPVLRHPVRQLPAVRRGRGRAGHDPVRCPFLHRWLLPPLVQHPTDTTSAGRESPPGVATDFQLRLGQPPVAVLQKGIYSEDDSQTKNTSHRRSNSVRLSGVSSRLIGVVSSLVRKDRKMMRRLAWVCCLAVGCAAGCAARVEPARLSQETENTVALCQGGWTQAAERELAAELTRRGGQAISREEVTQRGADTFRFGDLEGQEAVEAFNTYVTCILGVMQERTRRGMDTAPTEQEGEDNQSVATATDAVTWELYEVGRIPSGERVIQVPTPEQTRPNEEIQLHVVLPAGQARWKSQGMPRWTGGRCLTGWSRFQLLGSGTSYTARLYIIGNERDDALGHECRITLTAVLTDEEWFTRPELHNRVRDNFVWWRQEYNIVILPR